MVLHSSTYIFLKIFEFFGFIYPKPKSWSYVVFCIKFRVPIYYGQVCGLTVSKKFYTSLCLLFYLLFKSKSRVKKKTVISLMGTSRRIQWQTYRIASIIIVSLNFFAWIFTVIFPRGNCQVIIMLRSIDEKNDWTNQENFRRLQTFQ